MRNEPTRQAQVVALALVALLAMTIGSTSARAAVPMIAVAGEDPTVCTVNPSPTETVTALRFACDGAQLDRLFRSLHAGPMPAYASSARGYWRFCPTLCGLGEPTLNALMEALVWQGKVFYTGAAGGYLQNLVLGGHPAFRALVYYGTAQLDGGRAIIVDYRTSSDPLALVFRDELRQVQPGVYLGFGCQPPNQPTSALLWAITPSPQKCVAFILNFAAPTSRDVVAIG